MRIFQPTWKLTFGRLSILVLMVVLSISTLAISLALSSRAQAAEEGSVTFRFYNEMGQLLASEVHTNIPTKDMVCVNLTNNHFPENMAVGTEVRNMTDKPITLYTTINDKTACTGAYQVDPIVYPGETIGTYHNGQGYTSIPHIVSFAIGLWL